MALVYYRKVSGQIWYASSAGGLNLGPTPSGGSLLGAIGDTVYYLGYDGYPYRYIYETQGGNQTGVAITPIVTTDLVNFNGTAVFLGNGTNGYYALSRSDVTAGTVVLKEFEPGSFFAMPPKLFTVVGGQLFFVGYSSATGSELWVTDGTAAGTALVKDIQTEEVASGDIGSNPTSLVAYHGALFFVATTQTDGTQLWTSDGTPAGTHIFERFSGAVNGGMPSNLARVGDLLFFTETIASSGRELWVSDGTVAGTHLVKDISPGAVSSNPYAIVDVDGEAYFVANDGVHGYGLWKSDGTAQGTFFVGGGLGSLSLVVGNSLYVAGDGIYRIDVSGIHLVTPLTAYNLVNVGGTVYFESGDGLTTTLYKTNGTPASTVRVDTNIDPMAGLVVLLPQVKSDFDVDSRSDLFWRLADGSGVVWSLEGSAVARSEPVAAFGADQQLLATGDFNADHNADLMLRDGAGHVTLEEFSGRFVAFSAVIGTMGASDSVVADADFNGDGTTDLVWRDATSGNTFLWDMKGPTVLQGGTIASLAANWQVVSDGDFDGDKKADLLLRDNDTGNLFLWQMDNSHITASRYVATMPTAKWELMASADLDGDGKTDLVWRDTSTGNMFDWQMNGASVTSGDYVGTLSPSLWHVAATGDYNGDGRSDLLYEDTARNLVVSLQKGATSLGGGYIGTAPATWTLWDHQ